MSRCPNCGCQVESPFGGRAVVHDVARCGGLVEPAVSGSAERMALKIRSLMEEPGITPEASRLLQMALDRVEGKPPELNRLTAPVL